MRVCTWVWPQRLCEHPVLLDSQWMTFSMVLLFAKTEHYNINPRPVVEWIISRSQIWTQKKRWNKAAQNVCSFIAVNMTDNLLCHSDTLVLTLSVCCVSFDPSPGTEDRPAEVQGAGGPGACPLPGHPGLRGRREGKWWWSHWTLHSSCWALH